MELLIQGKTVDYDHCKYCGGKVPRGKSAVSWCCQKMRLCRYCYRWKFPRRKKSNLPVLRRGSERLLSWDERRHLEAAGFDMTLWSEDFRREFLEYLEARMRGEI